MIRLPEVTLSMQCLQQGLVWAVIAELTQASGILLSRSVFLQVDISPLWSSWIRISAGTLTALVIFWVQFQASRKKQHIPRGFSLGAIVFSYEIHLDQGATILVNLNVREVIVISQKLYCI